MRLILVDLPKPARQNFYPLALCRPIFELRSGMSTLGEKLIAQANCREAACFVPDYMADHYRQQADRAVNDVRQLRGDDVLFVDATVRADSLPTNWPVESCAVLSGDEVVCAKINRADLERSAATSIEELLAAAKTLPVAPGVMIKHWNYLWDLVLANAEQITSDFQRAGRAGIEGKIEEPNGLRGPRNNIYVAKGALVHPFVVLDAENGPIYIDEGAVIHPFTRIVGPCYIGRQTILFGAKCHAGNSFGPMCRIGGEVEESIVQGYSNKYHDGFLGHAFVGEWVNLGALTTNSDLKNDYSEVSVTLDGRHAITTGSTKCGALVGDHAKTSIGTILNTGAYLGAMSLAVSDGNLLPKFVPSFGWYPGGRISPGTGKERMFATAKIVLSRRGQAWTAADEAMWSHIHDITAEERDAAIARSQRRKTTS